MVKTLFPFRTKAMLRPSGDQAGLLSESRVVVSRRSASLPTAFTKISVEPDPADPDHAKATRLPSGDSAGGPSTPGYEASGSNSATAVAGVPTAREMNTAATTPATITRTPTTAIPARLRTGTRDGACGSERTI